MPPAKLHALLQKLLAVLKAGFQKAEVRLPIYGALLAYFQVCKPVGSGVSPEVFEASMREGNPQEPYIKILLQHCTNQSNQERQFLTPSLSRCSASMQQITLLNEIARCTLEAR